MSQPISFKGLLRLRKRDCVLTGVLIALSLLPWLGGGGGGRGELVIVRCPSGRFRYRLVGERRLGIDTGRGVLRLSFSRGTVRVEETGCPRKICKKRGAISMPGEAIICVPWRTEIRIAGRLRKGDVICR